MNEHKSDTLEQRKKAQQDFLLLKKMQSGEISPEEPKEEVIPLTFSEKIKNFWYHYKAHTILTVFFSIAIAIGISQCASKPNYDTEIVLYTNNVYTADQVQLLTEYLTPFFRDINGDGQVLIALSDCSYTTEGTYDSNRSNELASKLNATIATGVETQLYILDDKNLAQLNKLAENYGGFLTDSTPLPDDVAKLTDPNGYKFPEGLIIGKRVLNGTIMENNEKALAASEEATKVIENIKNKK